VNIDGPGVAAACDLERIRQPSRNRHLVFDSLRFIACASNMTQSMVITPSLYSTDGSALCVGGKRCRQLLFVYSACGTLSMKLLAVLVSVALVLANARATIIRLA